MHRGIFHQLKVEQLMKYSFVRKSMALALITALCSVPMEWSLASPPAYPLKASANGRYLVDQSNAPCLLIGESPQALIVNLTTNDAALFFTNRSGHGLNTAWGNLL